MLVKVMKSKLHRGRVTDAALHYPGSIAIDEELMQQSGILPYEAVLVADLDNGNRLETYAVPADSGNPATEAARQAIVACIRESCGVPLAEALQLQARHSAGFMSSRFCREGMIGTEAVKIMKV